MWPSSTLASATVAPSAPPVRRIAGMMACRSSMPGRRPATREEAGRKYRPSPSHRYKLQSPWASSPVLQEVRHRQSSVCRHRNSPWSSATPKWTVRGACPAGAPPGALPPPRASNICAHHSRPVRPAFKSWRTCVLQTPSTNTCPPVRLQEAHGLRDEMLAPQTVPAK